MDDLINKD